MASPFPGVDPYIEAQGLWPDYHVALIGEIRAALNQRLPEGYVAVTEQQVHLLDLSGDALLSLRPDVSVSREDRPATARGYGPGGGVATLEPVSLPIAIRDLDEVVERWIEIKRLPDLELVTVIEILSPTNKAVPGREEYVEKRFRLLEQPIHLVEIDLLLGGHRLPMGAPLPPGDAYAIVSRSDRRPNSDVYAWSIRRPLPVIPIPLKAPDPDVPLDLAAVAVLAYDRGRYDRLLRHERPLEARLAEADRAWVETIVPQRPPAV